MEHSMTFCIFFESKKAKKKKKTTIFSWFFWLIAFNLVEKIIDGKQMAKTAVAGTVTVRQNANLMACCEMVCCVHTI